LGRFPAADRSTAFYDEIDRWNRELAKDLAPVVGPEEAGQLAVHHNAAFFMELDR